jgi:hypothetical protein
MISNEFLILVPVVLGVVQALKELGLNSRYAPILSVLLGVGAIGLLTSYTGASALQGIVIGLTSSGLFSGVKRTLE